MAQLGPLNKLNRLRAGPAWRSLLEAHDEGKGSAVVVIHIKRASLNHISLALGNSVLAGEAVAGAILGGACIAVRVQLEVADQPDVLRGEGLLDRTHQEVVAVRAQRLEVQLHQHLVVGGGPHLEAGAQGQGYGEQHKKLHGFVGIIITGQSEV